MTATVSDVTVGMNDQLDHAFAHKTAFRLVFSCRIKTFGQLLRYSEGTLRTQHKCLDDEDIAEIKAGLANHGLELVQPQSKG